MKWVRKNRRENIKSFKFARFYSGGLKFYIIGVFVLISFLAFLVYRFDLLKINQVEIEVRNVDCVSREEISKRLDIGGKYIFLLDEIKIREKILKDNICVGDLKINKRFPNKVSVEVLGREAALIVFKITEVNLLAQLKDLESTPSSEAAKINFSYDKSSVVDKLFIDLLGVLFKKVDDSRGLPEIAFVNQEMDLGERLDQQVVENIKFVIDSLKSLSVPISSMKVEDGKYLIIDGQPKLLFLINTSKLGERASITYQIASLQLILQKAKMDSRLIESVDLRFDKPVVVYSAKK